MLSRKSPTIIYNTTHRTNGYSANFEQYPRDVQINATDDQEPFVYVHCSFKPSPAGVRNTNMFATTIVPARK